MTLAAIIVPVVLSAQQTALGANGPFLAVAAATADISSAIAVLFLALPNREFWRHAWPALIAVTAAVGWLAAPTLAPTLFAWAPQRPAPDMFLPGMVQIFGNVALLLAGGWIGYRRSLMRVALRWTLASGIVVIATGALLRQSDSALVWGFDKNIMGNRFTGTLLNANSSAALSAVTAILGLATVLGLLRSARVQTLDRGAAIWWFLGFLGCVMGIAACAATGSRNVLTLLTLALIGLCATDQVVRSAMFSWIGAISMAVVGIAIAILTLVASEMTIDRFATIGRDKTGRIDIWMHYWEVAVRSPWTGYGPSSFDDVNLQTMHDPTTAIQFWYLHAPHNAGLSLMLAGGIPYLALLALAVALMVLRVASARRTERQDPLLRGAVISVVLISLSAMVDIQLDVPAIAGLAIFLAALIWGRAIRRRVDRLPSAQDDASGS